MPFSAVLDACVLYPNTLRDTLLRIAEQGTYQPLWSEKILNEVRGALVRNGRSEEKADYALGCMKAAFPEAMVNGWESLESAMSNHPKDRHVLATAVRAHADVVVTANMRDFPASACEPFEISVQHPDTFLCYELEQAPYAIVQVLREQANATGRRTHRPMSIEDLLTSLANCGAPVFVSAVENWLPTQPNETRATG
ncbi:PIN domain-containing protein [Streptosporangium sp. CA-135522]|uniref:PIN domain-containing protein n=1 Tax=Streptosporangium sp. CA-135522 TaxID=3240072 RepID=UPI003D8C9A7F